jgi:hypothetical protein
VFTLELASTLDTAPRGGVGGRFRCLRLQRTRPSSTGVLC